jgi:2-methylcitrate dehydratase PrpD
MISSLDITNSYLVARSAIDAGARRAAKVALADGLGVMVAATGLEPAVKPFMAHAAALGQGAATLIGQGATASPVAAALANGALAHALDLEDTFERGKIHPNAALIPAVLALAESENACGDDLLAAMVLGCDFACRLSLALDGDPAQRGWYHPPILSGLGATLGCCTLLALDAEATVSALGLFLAQFLLSDDLKRSPRSHLRAVREGFGARAAVEAALLARAGVLAVDQPLEGQSGLFALLTGKPPRADAFEAIGQRFHGPDVGIKRWPSCRGTHTAVLAACALRNRGIVSSDIEAVSVEVGPPNDMLFVPRAQRIEPQTAIDAKFSIPFVFASALETGDLTLASFAPDRLRRSSTLALAARVSMADTPAPDGTEATYTVEVRGGGSVREVVDTVPVWRTGDLSPADLSPKLGVCLRASMRRPDLPAFLSAVAGLESQAISSLTRLL